MAAKKQLGGKRPGEGGKWKENSRNQGKKGEGRNTSKTPNLGAWEGRVKKLDGRIPRRRTGGFRLNRHPKIKWGAGRMTKRRSETGVGGHRD